MKKAGLFSIKLIIFIVIAWILAAICAFFMRDDVNSYTRILMHDMHTQKKIDTLICGASHVSHGLDAEKASSILGESIFNCGTPSQRMNGTYAMIQEACSLFDVKKIYLELDFAMIHQEDPKKDKVDESAFLVGHYMKNKKVEYKYFFNSCAPKYYLNTIFPLGTNQLITANPVSILNIAKSKLSGQYYKYEYNVSDSTYGGRGCVLDEEVVENGTFYSKGESPISVSDASPWWKENIINIIEYCRKNNIQLIFFSNPSSDFYLSAKGNYDEYIELIKSIISPYGFDYFDFSLLKPEHAKFEDQDFFDDNHLNKYGVKKFTDVFIAFFGTKSPAELSSIKNEFFYDSYKEKCLNEPERIYGLILSENSDKKGLTINPVYNYGDESKITYDVYVEVNGTKTVLQEKSTQNTISYPANSSGTIKIVSYYDGKEMNKVEKHFTCL